MIVFSIDIINLIHDSFLDKSLFNQLLITLWWNQAEKAKDCISKVAKLASEKEV